MVAREGIGFSLRERMTGHGIELSAGIGALLVIAAWVQAFRRSGRTEGTITGIVKSKDSDDRSILAPVISYKVNGKKYSFEGWMWITRRSASRQVGRKVRVAFDPANPEKGEIATPFRLYFGQIVLTAGYGMLLYFWLKR